MNLRDFDRLIQRAGAIPDQVLDDAYKFFLKQTPIRTGNARANTYKTQDSIEADYPYAQRLDTGWSRQSPEGMTGPTEQYIEQTLNQRVRSIP